MGATVTSIRVKFPEFNTTDDTAVQFALDEAEIFLGSWGGRARDIAWMYLTAHLLAVSRATADSDGREITSETIGRISTSYKVGGNKGTINVGDLLTTTYGNRYIQLKNLGTPKFQIIRPNFGPGSPSNSGCW